MRLAILTTETPHHAYFVKALASGGHDIRVFSETRTPTPKYPVSHPFEAARDKYERSRWFTDQPAALANISTTETYDSLNEPAAFSSLQASAPDAVIVFGTGLLRDPIVGAFANRIVNLHGGDPETYRGLDTHLWAVWHQDFAGLLATLHLLDGKIDHGAIISRKMIPLRHGMALHELRAENTQVCVDLAREALSDFAQIGRFTAREQRTPGRYYSAMPAVLKEACVARFARYTDTL